MFNKPSSEPPLESNVLVTPVNLFLLASVTLLALAGFALRWNVASEPLWLDELHTSWVVRDGLDQVAWRAKIGNQSPVYFWLVFFVKSTLGLTPFSLRLASLAAGLALLILTPWILFRASGNATAAIVSCWLIAIDPTFVFYSSEARPYVFVQLLGLLQLASFWQVIRFSREKPRFLAATCMTLLSVALFYTHYTSIWLFAAEAAFLLLIYRSSRETLPIRLILIAVVAWLVCCLPGLMHLFDVFDRRSNWNEVSDNLAFIRVNAFRALPFIVIPAIASTVVGIALRPTGKRVVDWDGKLIVLALTCALVPALCCLACSLLKIAPLALDRYAVVGLVGYPMVTGLLLGAAVPVIRSPLARFLFVISVLAAMTFPFNSFFCQTIAKGQVMKFRFENWQPAIQEINENEAKRNQPVFLFANVIEDVDAYTRLDARFQSYLRFPVAGIYKIRQEPRGLIAGPTVTRQNFLDRHTNMIQQQGGGWLLIRGDNSLVVSIVNQILAKIPDAELRTLSSNDNYVVLVSID